MKTALTLALILAASWAWGQEVPEAPSSTAHKMLATAAILSIGADAYITQVNLTECTDPVRCHLPHEFNPLARPFVTHGPYLRASFFAVTAAGFYFADRRLNRHHPQLARVLECGVLVSEIYFTERSMRHGW
jgi:hypothetical protein